MARLQKMAPAFALVPSQLNCDKECKFATIADIPRRAEAIDGYKAAGRKKTHDPRRGPCGSRLSGQVVSHNRRVGGTFLVIRDNRIAERRAQCGRSCKSSRSSERVRPRWASRWHRCFCFWPASPSSHWGRWEVFGCPEYGAVTAPRVRFTFCLMQTFLMLA